MKFILGKFIGLVGFVIILGFGSQVGLAEGNNPTDEGNSAVKFACEDDGLLWLFADDGWLDEETLRNWRVDYLTRHRDSKWRSGKRDGGIKPAPIPEEAQHILKWVEPPRVQHRKFYPLKEGHPPILLQEPGKSYGHALLVSPIQRETLLDLSDRYFDALWLLMESSELDGAEVRVLEGHIGKLEDRLQFAAGMTLNRLQRKEFGDGPWLIYSLDVWDQGFNPQGKRVLKWHKPGKCEHSIRRGDVAYRKR